MFCKPSTAVARTQPLVVRPVTTRLSTPASLLELRSLPFLVKLDLAFNRLTSLPSSSFWSSLPALKLLYLQMLGRQSRAPGTHDSTVYGEARASPKAFYRHHTAAISAAVASADATVLLNAAATMSFELTFAPPAFSFPSL